MSDYWKSTPRYWCKHCSTYVKDTKLERSQHEATGKHQGNLRRFLKGLQDGQERGEREKQRAKAEVDRLNKTVGGASASLIDYNAATNRNLPSLSVTPQASITERKKQLAQLVEMGIAVPDEFRADMAIAGDWKVVSQRPVEEPTADDPLSIGVRKRKFEGQEEEEEAGEVVARRGWGSTSRRYPGLDKGEVPNLDALLSGLGSVRNEDTTLVLQKEENEKKSAILATKDDGCDMGTEQAGKATSADSTPIKKEEPADPFESANTSHRVVAAVEESLGGGVVFKKRKPKSTKEK